MRKARRGGKLPRRPLVRSLRFQTTDKPHKRKIPAVQIASAGIFASFVRFNGKFQSFPSV